MAKIWIIDPTDKTKVPFLRGILTRSLTEAGLSFDEAYKTSSEIRQLLDDSGELMVAPDGQYGATGSGIPGGNPLSRPLMLVLLLPCRSFQASIKSLARRGLGQRVSYSP